MPDTEIGFLKAALLDLRNLMKINHHSKGEIVSSGLVTPLWQLPGCLGQN